MADVIEIVTDTPTVVEVGTVGPQGPAGSNGSNGSPGENGDSAYEIAVANGFVGTEQQWLASLVGATGAQGPQGEQGTGIETLTTAGDLLTHDGDSAVRLPIGDPLQTLRVNADGDAIEWAEPSGGVTSYNDLTDIPASFPPEAHAASHAAGGSDQLFDQNLSTTDSPSFNKLTLTPDTGDSSLKLGTLEFQSYLLNNAWIGDNVYYDGSNFKRRNAGAATLFYFQGSEGQFRCDDSDNVGTVVTIAPAFKVGAGGKFSAGANVSNEGDFEAGMLWSDGSNVGMSDASDNTKKAIFDLSGISPDEIKSLSLPDASGTLALTDDIVTSYSDLTDKPTLGTAAAKDAPASGNATSSQVVLGDDTRLTDSRTPTSHSHTPSEVGLSNVTNNAQTQAAIVPNTAPSAGQILAGNSGGTAYTPVTMSGDATLSSTGAITLANSGATAGTFKSVTVDAKGRVTSGTNPTTLSGYGITDAATSSQGTKADSALQPSLADAKGDLLVATANDTVARLAVSGNNGYVLTEDSSQSAGVKWAALPSGGATNIWIPASAWIPRTTTGCGVNSLEAATNKVNYDLLEFDTATQEYAQIAVVMPNNWNASTVTAKFHWTAASGSGGVVWQLSGRAYADNNAIDQATGTAQTVADTLQTAAYEHITAATSAITLAGSPAAGQLVIFELSRKVSDASDDLGVDARFIGAEITYTAS